MNRRIRRNQGFTLVEVLLVLGILVTLAAVSISVFGGTEKKAKISAATAQIESLCTQSIDIYIRHMGEAPETLEDLLNAPDDEEKAKEWGGPYVKKNKFPPKDPWGKELIYERLEDDDGNNTYKLTSSGPNKTEGDDDDISNIEDDES
ncbi:MAG: prepilin-type N-terminal cleavage/methylation domain-containing protein [Phycisphaerales bacterium]|jgi:general secretion pathway protein G|nr:prepilin-type N-terminal cleavage/methylation domain-containing protein [Phycisphaerales bacterium]MBT7171682.1 prepilin-type N-terminal cleavage/methylation domain-containing protein [Phycisphaerales bacterium]